MKKVTDLTPDELNNYVAKANGLTDTLGGIRGDEPDWMRRILKATYRPSADWCQGGNIIERENISILYDTLGGKWSAIILGNPAVYGYGDAPLLAAMRCYVASVFGETVDD